MLLVVFHFLFRVVLSVNIPRYSSFAFSGLLVFTWFQTSLFQSAGAITDNRELIRQPGFPSAILPAVTVTTNLIHFLLALPILIIFLVTGEAQLKPTVLLLPLVMALQFVFTLSLSYLVATANVRFRDTQHLLSVLLTLLFYITPVFYDAKAVPARYQFIYHFNPMAQIVEAYRAVLVNGTLPDWSSLLVLGVIAIGLLKVGHQIFIWASHRFVEEL
jgi:lipopolysaccharide transport system permease protein